MKKLFSILMSVLLIMGCISLPVSPVVEKAEAATKWGIDVSEHQGKIDWEKVKASGCDFAIIRCGYGQDKYSQDDDYWEYNSSECERLGIPYGTYLYSYATNTTAAYSEAQHTLRLLEGKNLSYPVYFDMEDNSTTSAGKSGLAAIAKTYCNTIEAAGYSVGVYSGTYWWNTWLTDSCFNNWYRWVAQYNSTCTYGGRYEIWQCTDSWSVPGISGGVDGNYQYTEVSGSTTIEEKLTTNKSTYGLDEAINVTASTAKSDAWVAIYGANDTISSATSSYYWYWVNGTDTQYGHGGSWTRGQTYNIYEGICSHRTHPNGTMITGTLPTGSYKVVVLYGDYQVLMSKTITISGTSVKPSMELSKPSFAEGEDIRVKAYSDKENAWVGIFPGSSPTYGTGSYIYYYYTSDYNGTYVTLQKAGTQNASHSYKNLPAGTYTLVLFGDDGYDYKDVTKTITITASDPLVTDKTSYTSGDAVKVTASCSADGSWVGLYKSNETPGDSASMYWYYVRSSADGINRSGQTIEISDSYYMNEDRGESLAAGDYKIVLFGDSGYSNIIKSVNISIGKKVTKVVTVDSTCTKTGTITTYYSDGSTDVETIAKKAHLYTNKVMTAQTCTTQGYTTYKCVNCTASYKADYVPATGHYRGQGVANCVSTKCTACNVTLAATESHKPGAAATCTAPQTCTACGTVLANKTGHTPGPAATCMNAQTCKVCSTVLVGKTAHTPGAAATCTTPQTCTVAGCGAVIKPATGHKLAPGISCTDPHRCTVCGVTSGEGTAHTPGPAATCTTPQTCTVCNAELAAALDHDMAAATCTAASKCKRTGCDYTEGNPAAHTPEADAAVEPECTRAGLTAGSHCAVCEQVLVAQQIVPATGHDWKEAGCTLPMTCMNCGITSGAPAGHEWETDHIEKKPTCTENGSRVDRCKNGCGETNTVTLSPTGHKYVAVVTEPTCTEDGYTTYTCHNEGCGSTKTGNKVRARHTPGPAATCTKPQTCTKCPAVLEGTTDHTPGPAPTCTEMQTCTVCDTILAGAKGHKPGREATCTTPQICSVEGCGYVFEAATGHTRGKAATCNRAQTCTDCDFVFEEAKGHTPGAAATCTKPQRCTECHVELKAMQGHTPGNAPTCETAQSCTTCNAVLVPATGHSLITVPAVEATCTQTGLTEGRICGVCGDVFSAQSTVAKKVHAYEDVLTPATADKDGNIAETCKHCGKVLSTETFARIGKVKLSYKDTGYTGKRKSPDVDVTDGDGNAISKEFYDVSKPSGRIKVGTYTYTITFKGKYAGTKQVTLIINPARPESKKPAAAKKSVTVKWKKYTKQVTGYQVMVATNKNFTKNKKSLTMKKATVSSKKVTGLKAKTKYYVKVRSYKIVDGKKYYSRWSDVWNIKTR